MSLPVEVFESCYKVEDKEEYPELMDDCVYPFGVDHVWYLGKNELTYMNSLKMKLSVIFGIAQMSLGIFLKASNALYFDRKLDFYFEFIPQITLLWAIFGYMITLIIVKWLTFYKNTNTAPSIIGYMIDMFLNFGAISGDAIIHSQGLNEALHIFLLFTAVLCIPAMLVIKPFMIYKQTSGAKKSENYEMQELHGAGGSPSKKQKYQKFEEEDDHQIGHPHEEHKQEEDIRVFKRHKIGEDLSIPPAHDNLKDRLYSSVSDLMDHGNHSISEIAIHQLIETIEFVLGTISNTASYLRLWALSLAHSQLAAVFFEKTLEPALEIRSSIMLTLCFPIFASATIGVLM